MNVRHVWTVFKKEMKDITRDKRTVLMSLVVPMVLIPLLNILVGGGVQKLQNEINQNITIALADNSNTSDIKELVQNRLIGNDPNIKLVETDNPVEALKQEQVRVVLEFEKDYAQKLAVGKPFTLKLIYDKSKTKSSGGLQLISTAIEKMNKSILADRMVALGQSVEILEPSIVEESNIANAEQMGTSALMMILPLMLVIFVASGGIPAATDLVAGEKERNTFEPLLTTKPSRASILMGKYLAVTVLSFVSVIAIIAGFIISYSINPNSLTGGAGDQITGFYVPPFALVLSILIAITLGLTFAGIQIALSTYAKSFKEAQTYMGFLTIAAMIPAYSTMFMQPNDIPNYMFFVPILNSIASFKMVLGGSINYVSLLVALATSIIYVYFGLEFAASMFKKEKVLFRS